MAWVARLPVVARVHWNPWRVTNKLFAFCTLCLGNIEASDMACRHCGETLVSCYVPNNGPRREPPEPEIKSSQTQASSRPQRTWSTTDGWIDGEQAYHRIQSLSTPCIDPNVESEAEREFRLARERVEARANSVSMKFAHLMVRTRTDSELRLLPQKPGSKKTLSQRELARRRIYGLEQGLEAILADLRVEYAEIEKRDLSDIEIIESREASANAEYEARSMIRSRPNRGERLNAWSANQGELECLREQAHEDWRDSQLSENAQLLVLALNRYWAEWHRGVTWTNESLFPVWDKVDDEWRLVNQPLCAIFEREKAERGGDDHRAFWTLAKMVDRRNESKLAFKRKCARFYKNGKPKPVAPRRAA